MSQPKLGQVITDGADYRDAIHVAVVPVQAGESLDAGDRVQFAPHSRTAVVGWDGEAEAVGVVDPYLPHGVSRGQRFWLCLFPQTVTSLHHEWEHPLFPKGVPVSSAGLAVGAAPVQPHAPRDWRTETVRSLLAGIRADRAYDRLPVLADALEEAGYDGSAGVSLGELRTVQSCRREAYWGQRVVALLSGGEAAEAVNRLQIVADGCNQTYERLMRALEDYAEHDENTRDDTEAYKDFAWDGERVWADYQLVTGNEKLPEWKDQPFTCSC